MEILSESSVRISIFYNRNKDAEQVPFFLGKGKKKHEIRQNG